MGVWRRSILPRLVDCACGSGAIARERARLAPAAVGDVLEIGFGSGRNLPFYDPARVRSLVGVEPEEGMLALGREAAARAAFPVTLIPSTTESAGLGAAAFDTVLVTFTLCTIPDAVAALRAAAPALKPSGTLLFCEHGLAPEARVRRMQRRIEPMWRRLAGGCRLTKHIPSLIQEAGFEIAEMSEGYSPGAPRFAGYIFRGAARRSERHGRA